MEFHKFKRVLLVGNGFDINFNTNFKREKLIEKIIIFKKFEIDVIKEFIENNGIIRKKWYDFFEKNKATIAESFNYGLLVSDENDSIETIFSNILFSFKKVIFEKIKKWNNKINLLNLEHFLKILKKRNNESEYIKNTETVDKEVSIDDILKEIDGFSKQKNDLYNIPEIIPLAKSCFSLIEKFNNFLKTIFIFYLEKLSSQVKSPSKTKDIELWNKMNSKLSVYDYILTTNYTSIIEILAYGNNKFEEIDYIHGKIKNNLNYDGIQLNNDSKNKINNLEKFKKWLFNNQENNIFLDIYGMSVKNDDHLFKELFYLLNENSDITSKTTVNYFGHTDQDIEEFKTKFYNYINNSKLDFLEFSLKKDTSFFGLFDLAKV